jgi:Glycosyl hydrolase family 12
MRNTLHGRLLKDLHALSVRVQIITEGCDGTFFPVVKTRLLQGVEQVLHANGMAIQKNDAEPQLIVEVRTRVMNSPSGGLVTMVKIETMLREPVVISRNRLKESIDTWRHRAVCATFAGVPDPRVASQLIEAEVLRQVESFVDDHKLQAERLPAPIPVEEMCADYTRIPVGGYVFENNTWGRGKLLPGETFRQCLQRRVMGGQQQLGWTWSWPDRIDRTVYAYPEVIFGWKPWESNNTTDQLPKQVKQLKSVVLDYDVEQRVSNGVYDLAPEIWITNAATGITRQSVTAELMFWMDYNDMDPAGKQVDKVEIGGRFYDVFQKDDMGGPAPQPRWRYLAFRAQQKGVMTASVPIHEFIQYAVRRGVVNPDHFLAAVEFGNEICSGRGETWVRRCEVVVK